MKQRILFFMCLLISVFTEAQVKQPLPDNWRLALERKDGKQVVFQLLRGNENGKMVLYVINAAERIKITDVKIAGDSMFFTMPAFESSFRVKLQGNGNMKGIYLKGTSGNTQYWPLSGYANIPDRFSPVYGEAKNNISGKWDVSITRANGSKRKAVAVFEQNGNKLTGSFLTPSADYRYLDGIVTGDSLFLSAFDGDNVHLFEAKISDANTISGGIFYNGYIAKETWTAQKNNSVALPEIDDPTRLREGASKLDFTFNNLQGVPVSINDEKYKNKVVVIQLMGSWCANCLDETKFLSGYYKRNRSKGVEIIALAYELTTDAARSQKSLAKFQKLFDVQYPMLITGVTAGDENKTEKTLPQLTPIRSFPTTIFIDKKGNVREVHTNFYGPASGEYYIASKNKFYETVDRLLNE
ncbi:TlpA family protein disulfide reductase [Ginsengibacter hankyongi]|uniref:TlpA family protein disulfide reductase n=1 Tax=Ginsengibacter hankyongi TaxID=2607284 RepID=A0A5J5IF33_9BACT|nr:TlpA disulfide reductase family protein [Ginsengibacter hankyongi]KAA9037207.1 TlpA family protein disulfide reductase [Ginsengibacter hankyongi]